MNYTPNDLQNLTFKKNFSGYNEDAVNDVLDKVIEDYSAYIRENVELKDKLALLNDGLQHYKSIEESLQNALIVAQQTGEDVKKSAYEKADNVIHEAEIRAQKLINDANQEVVKVKFEYEEAKKKLHIFKSKCEMLLATQMELLQQMFENGEE